MNESPKDMLFNVIKPDTISNSNYKYNRLNQFQQMNKLITSQLLYGLSRLKQNKGNRSFEPTAKNHLIYGARNNIESSRQQLRTIYYKNTYGFNSRDDFFNTKYAQKPKISVESFLNSHNIQYRTNNTNYQIKYCPFCNKPHNNDPTNMYTLNLNKEYGYFHCFRCGSSGSLLKFREKVLGLDEDESIDMSNQGRNILNNQSENIQKLSEAEYFHYKSNLKQLGYADVMQYIMSRGLTKDTIQYYNLGAGVQEFIDAEGEKHQVKCIYFPYYKVLSEKEQKKHLSEEFKRDKTNSNLTYWNDWTDIVKAKVRGSGKENKMYMRQFPNGQKGLFGLNIVKDSDKTVIITQGQFDAMAVFQHTSIPALSLPQGATNFPQELLPYLSKFQKVILWMDNDESGKINTPKIAERIGLKRTYIVKHDFKDMKDANDFLLNNPSQIEKLLQMASTIPDNNLITFKMMKSIIEQRMLKTQQNHGAKVTWLPFFNKTVKGIRMGELTVVSGPTGSGKTTFLSQLTVDLCKKDISVLWGSFEIRNEILMTSMLMQFSEIQLDKHMEKYEYYANQFAALPLRFMNFYGSQDIQKVLSTIIYSIEKYNTNVIVIDTLQFLLSDQESGFKKFQLQDSFMSKLRQISINYNVHVAIVIHPKKVQDNEDLGLHSIYGTSKSTQEADNVWIIQNRPGFKLFEIKKNRYDGEIGRIPLGFDKKTKLFFQLRRKQFQNVIHKQRSMSQIVSARDDYKQSKGQYKLMTADQILAFEQQIEDTKMIRKRV